MFWELDYVSMDFNENIPVDFISLPLISAIDENDLDIRSLVKDDDDAYLIQPEIGNEVILKFASDVNTINNDQITKSIIFHSKGYYERIREFDNPPDWFSLLYHKHNHAFSKFSHSEFERLKALRFLAAQN